MGDTKICRYCGNVIYSDEETCEFCGKYLLKEHDNPDLFCAKCKAEVNTDDNFCQRCGAVFNIPEEEVIAPIRHNIAGIPYNIGIFLTSIAASIAITVFYTSGKDTGFDFAFLGLAFVLAEIFLYIYFLPAILAFENNNPNAYFIYVLNLLLGVTVVGWILALVFALKSDKKA